MIPLIVLLVSLGLAAPQNPPMPVQTLGQVEEAVVERFLSPCKDQDPIKTAFFVVEGHYYALAHRDNSFMLWDADRSVPNEESPVWLGRLVGKEQRLEGHFHGMVAELLAAHHDVCSLLETLQEAPHPTF